MAHPIRKAKVLERDRTISTVVKGTQREIAVANVVIVAIAVIMVAAIGNAIVAT
jgi:hypothetical protein